MVDEWGGTQGLVTLEDVDGTGPDGKPSMEAVDGSRDVRHYRLYAMKDFLKNVPK